METSHLEPTINKSSNQAWISYGYYRQRMTKGSVWYMPDNVAGAKRLSDDTEILERDIASDDWTNRAGNWVSQAHFLDGKPESSNSLFLDGHTQLKDFATEVEYKYTSSRPSDIWW